MSALQNSYGPEVTPYQKSPEQSPLEHDPSAQHSPSAPVAKGLTKEEQAPEAVDPQPTRRRKILGLPAKIFYALVALTIVVVLALAIGVGVGVGTKHSSGSKSDADKSGQSSASASSAPTSTSGSSAVSGSSASATSSASPSGSASPITSGTHGVAANSCTFKDPKTYTSGDGTQFTEYCFTDWPNGQPSANGKTNVTDLKVLTSYTFESCMDACADYNDGLKGADADTPCRAITYNANLTLAIEVTDHAGNCWLKNAKGEDKQGTAQVASAAYASA